MIRLTEITNDTSDVDAFATTYEQAGGFPLDQEYVRRCRVFAFRNGQGTIVGGFLVNPAAPFRSLNDMPEAARSRIIAGLDLSQTYEAACFWMARDLRGTPLAMVVWAQFLLWLRRFPRRVLLLSTVSEKVYRLYSNVKIETLYRGHITLSGKTLVKYVAIYERTGVLLPFLRVTLRRLLGTLTHRRTSSLEPGAV